MTTKTPDEIIAQMMLENYGPEGDAELYAATQLDCETDEPTVAQLLDSVAWMRDLNGDGVRKLMVAAIEADRAEREEVAVTLPSGQEITAWIGTSHADGSALVQIDTGGTDGNVRVFINDGEDPAFDQNPETGEYQDMLEGEGE